MQPSDPAKYNDPRHVAEKVERTTQGALHDVGKKVHLMQTSTTCERHKQHVDEINAYQTSACQCDFVLRLTALRFEVLSFPRNCTSKKARIRSRWALKINPFPLLLNAPNNKNTLDPTLPKSPLPFTNNNNNNNNNTFRVSIGGWGAPPLNIRGFAVKATANDLVRAGCTIILQSFPNPKGSVYACRQASREKA